MAAFVACVERLRNADLVASAFHDELPEDVLDASVLQEIAIRAIEALGSVAAGGVAGIAAGQAAVFGVTTLASAGTGVPIAVLSGAAAQNATLAWLGGGALSAGGGGVAAGGAVLAGAFAAPGLLVGGFLINGLASKKLAQANENAREIEAHVARLAAGAEVWTVATSLAAKATTTLQRLRAQLASATDRINSVTDSESDVAAWNLDQRAELRAAGNLAGMLTGLASCPLIASDGLIDRRFAALLDRADGLSN